MTHKKSKELHEYLNSKSYLDLLHYLVKNFPKSYGHIIKGKQCKLLYKWIIDSTPKLNNTYTLSTRVYWILHNITDFPCCKICGKQFLYNVKVSDGYFTTCKKCNNSVYSARTKHTKETCLRKYGVISNMATKEFKKQKIKTYLKHYGTTNNMKSIKGQLEYKNAMRKKYGVENPSQIHEVRIKQLQKYSFNGINFDSKPELAYYIWCTDNNIEFEYLPKLFKMTYVNLHNKTCTYFPDFLLTKTNELIEIKGDLFFDNENRPYNIYYKEFWYEKYKLMLENNVKIMRSAEYIKYIIYVELTYGKHYLDKYRKCK